MSQDNLPFTINVQNDTSNNAVTNVDIKGDLSFATVPSINEQVTESFHAGQHIYVDLGEIQHADSAAMALILEWHRLAKEQNSKITLLNIPPILKNIARVTDLEEILL